jgi:hypothetical protein
MNLLSLRKIIFKHVVDQLKLLVRTFDNGVGLRTGSEWGKLNIALCGKNKIGGIFR